MQLCIRVHDGNGVLQPVFVFDEARNLSFELS